MQAAVLPGPEGTASHESKPRESIRKIVITSLSDGAVAATVLLWWRGEPTAVQHQLSVFISGETIQDSSSPSSSADEEELAELTLEQMLKLDPWRKPQGT